VLSTPIRPLSFKPKQEAKMSKLDDNRKKYHSHKHNAKQRGIAFDLTFEQWMKIWLESGKFSERGRRKGQYCMCRKLDKGGYSVGNVRIRMVEQNIEEARHSAKAKTSITTSQAWSMYKGDRQLHGMTPYQLMRYTEKVMSGEVNDDYDLLDQIP
jgi:hypothetical protein